MTVIADTGFVVSVVNTEDRYHRACQTLYAKQNKIYLVQPALTEVAYLLRHDIESNYVTSFLERLQRSLYELVALTPEDIRRTAEILRKYNDSRIDFVDAGIVAVAERLEITRILTLDHRDFGLIRPNHTPYFELLPPPRQS